MKYDTLTLQIFQETLEKVENTHHNKQLGICDAIFKVCLMPIIHYYGYDYYVVKWMQENYMPHKDIGGFWWPVDFNGKNEDFMIKTKKYRIAFLKRIIEDLMCGE